MVTYYIQNNVRSCAEETNGEWLSMVEQLVTLALWTLKQRKQRQGYEFKLSLGKTERTLFQTNKKVLKKRKTKTKMMKKSKPNKQVNKTTNHPHKQTSKTQEPLEPELQCDLFMGLC